MAALIQQVNWASVNKATRREVRNREIHCPAISLFRWWARRPHALARALLKASRLRRNDLISDPLSGGGTVTIEAAVSGHRVYAQDINPWPTWGLQVALDGVAPSRLKAGIDSFWRRLRETVASEYATNCPEHGSGEILHTFWVRQLACKRCNKKFFLFPYSLITLASRNHDERLGFFGCSACGHVTRSRLSRRARCGRCRRLLAFPHQPLLIRKIARCPHCTEEISHSVAWTRRPRWVPVLVQRKCRCGGKEQTHFDCPTALETKTALKRHKAPDALRRRIPKGRETAVLLRGGFKHWSDLYPPRQLVVLFKAAELAHTCSSNGLVQRRIQLAVAGAGEMAGYLCRWDRFHPKPFEALANHRYSVLGLAVETNLAAERGRGTLKRRLLSSLTAARWMHEHLPRHPSASTTSGDLRQPVCTIVTGSSAAQRLNSDSVGLVITDPPYYDAVQYGELSGLFLVWAQIATGQQRFWRPNLRSEAVPNEVRGAGAPHYERMLSSILAETSRTLRPTGKLLLTYHSTDFRGWFALGKALHLSGLKVLALAVAHSENEKDHPKRNSHAFTRDLVIECQKRKRRVRTPLVVTIPRQSDQRELLAAGRVIASLSQGEYREMAKKYLEMTRRLRSRRIRVPFSQTSSQHE